MSMEISYPNTGLISPNYDAINKANKILAGKTAEDLKANTSGTMQELSTEEVREMREKARNEQRTLNVDRSEIVNNVYWKTGDNITYNVDGVSFTNEEMKACKEVVKNAIAALPTKGSDLDYEDYAAMGIAANMVNTYATEHLTVEQAEVINKSINDYLDSLVQAEKERHAQSGYFIDDTKGVGSTGELNKYYAVRQQLSEGAAESLRSQTTSNLPENTRNTLLDNLEHASKQGSVAQSASNEQLADTIRTLFQNLKLSNGNAVNDAFARYREIMTPVYKANGIENTANHDSLSHVLEQDTNRFSMQIANAKAVISGMGSSVNITV
ncbi:MAG: hypothetical protein IJ485_00930 [Lachnospiraceae bacterium]|nr:hypothetical protein [Lachnospiraceae bacterium]